MDLCQRLNWCRSKLAHSSCWGFPWSKEVSCHCDDGQPNPELPGHLLPLWLGHRAGDGLLASALAILSVHRPGPPCQAVWLDTDVRIRQRRSPLVPPPAQFCPPTQSRIRATLVRVKLIIHGCCIASPGMQEQPRQFLMAPLQQEHGWYTHTAHTKPGRISPGV